MAQLVRGVFDLGRGLAVGDPRQDEARAREASARSEKDLRSTIAGRLVNQQVQQRQLELQAADLAQRAQSEQQRMAQQESQFSRGQAHQSGESALERAFRERMQQEGFGFESEQRGLDRGQQESQFGRSFGLEQRGQEMMKDQFEQRMGLERDQFGFTKERAGVDDARFSKTFGYTQQRDKEQDQWMRDRAKVEDTQRGLDRTQRGEQFDTDQRNNMLRHAAEYAARTLAQRQARQEGLRQEAMGRLGPLMDAIERGEALDPSNDGVKEVMRVSRLNPELGREMEAILGDFARTAINERFQEQSLVGREAAKARRLREAARTPAMGPIQEGIIEPTRQWWQGLGYLTDQWGITDSPAEERLQGLKSLESLFGGATPQTRGRDQAHDFLKNVEQEMFNRLMAAAANPESAR